MKNLFLIIIILLVGSCTSQPQHTPETFIRTIESIDEDFNRLFDSGEFLKIISQTPEDFKKEQKEVNKLIRSSLDKLEGLPELDKDFPVKKELYKVLESSEALINDKALLKIIQLGEQVEQDTQVAKNAEEINQKVSELGGVVDIAEELFPKITSLQKEIEQLQKTIEGFYTHYKITPAKK